MKKMKCSKQENKREAKRKRIETIPPHSHCPELPVYDDFETGPEGPELEGEQVERKGKAAQTESKG